MRVVGDVGIGIGTSDASAGMAVGAGEGICEFDAGTVIASGMASIPAVRWCRADFFINCFSSNRRSC